MLCCFCAHTRASRPAAVSGRGFLLAVAGRHVKRFHTDILPRQRLLERVGILQQGITHHVVFRNNLDLQALPVHAQVHLQFAEVFRRKPKHDLIVARFDLMIDKTILDLLQDLLRKAGGLLCIVLNRSGDVVRYACAFNVPLLVHQGGVKLAVHEVVGRTLIVTGVEFSPDDPAPANFTASTVMLCTGFAAAALSGRVWAASPPASTPIFPAAGTTAA